jgi:amino acid transporter
VNEVTEGNKQPPVKEPNVTLFKHSTEHADDDATLAHLGYPQQLRRSLGFLSLFTVSFSVISITTGLFTNLGFGLANFGPAAIWTWPIVVVGVLILSLILSELGSRMPIAGIGYQWASRLTTPSLGFIVAVLIFSAFMLASGGETLLLIAPLMANLFGFTGASTAELALLSVGIFILIAVINILSVRLTARVNNISLVTELLGTVVLGIVLLIVALTSNHPVHASILFNTVNPNHNKALYGFALASLMSVFTLEGQESASDLGEEGRGVRMGVPRAILGSVILSGIFGMITLVCIGVVIPNLSAAAASPTPIAYITNYWLGSAAGKIFLVFIIYSVFALIVVSIAAMARLLFSLSRDNMLPASKAISKVNERTQTPITAIVVTTTLFIVVMLIAAIFPSAYAILIASTPILAYLGYLTITVSYAIRRRHVSHIPTAFDLGKWAVPVFTVAFIYLVVVLGILTLPHVFYAADRTVGIVIAVAVIYYFAWLRPKIQRGEAGRSLLVKADTPAVAEPEQPSA